MQLKALLEWEARFPHSQLYPGLFGSVIDNVIPHPQRSPARWSEQICIRQQGDCLPD